MSLVADIELTSDLLPFVDVAAAVPEVSLTIRDGRQNESGPAVMFLGATGDSFAALEDALSEEPDVESAAIVTESDGERLYQVLYVREDDIDLERITLRKALFEAIRVTPNGWRVRGRFSGREELVALREFAVENGVSFRLERLTETDRDRNGLDRLTDGQREALLTAHEMGYFEVPRGATLDDVAGALGITAPSLSERMRRAQGRLIDHYAEEELIKARTD